MIPLFPKFKKISLGDKKAIEVHTHAYDPYSDFNFTSLFSWDTSEERMVSELNGNLVVRFTDYITNEPFLSFLGTIKTEQTARTLIDYSIENGMPATLSLVPEISTVGMRTSVLKIEEDRGNFDYLYSIPTLSVMSGGSFEDKRKFIRRFLRANPDAHTEVIDLAIKSVQKDIVSVIRLWEGNEIAKAKEYEIEYEETAIKRLFESADSHKLLVTGLFSKKKMLAFSIEEMLPNQYCIGHFWKANKNNEGSYDFLMQQKAKHFETLNLSLLNYEQDLGLAPLRHSKKAFRPVSFLKKYKVSLQ